MERYFIFGVIPIVLMFVMPFNVNAVQGEKLNKTNIPIGTNIETVEKESKIAGKISDFKSTDSKFGPIITGATCESSDGSEKCTCTGKACWATDTGCGCTDNSVVGEIMQEQSIPVR